LIHPYSIVSDEYFTGAWFQSDFWQRPFCFNCFIQRPLWVVLCRLEMRLERQLSLKETLNKLRWEAIFGQEQTLSNDAMICYQVKIHIILLL